MRRTEGEVMLSKYWMMVLTAATATVAWSGNAAACSVEYWVDYQVANFATPDRIVYTTSDIHDVEIVTVADADGSEISGAVEELELAPNALAFVPEEPLVPGTYTVTIVGEIPDRDGTTHEVVVSDEMPALELDFQAAATEVESPGEMVCCATSPDECYDGCGDTCDSCWPGSWEYLPLSRLTVEMNQPLVLRAKAFDGVSETPFWEQTALATGGSREFQALGANELESDDLCLELKAESLDGDEVFTERRCERLERVAASERTPLDFPDAVAQCDSPPADTSDPNWQRYGADPVAMPTVAGPTAGCDTTSKNPASLVVALLLAVAALVGRRRRA